MMLLKRMLCTLFFSPSLIRPNRIDRERAIEDLSTSDIYVFDGIGGVGFYFNVMASQLLLLVYHILVMLCHLYL
jgi:hypothetical protein